MLGGCGMMPETIEGRVLYRNGLMIVLNQSRYEMALPDKLRECLGQDIEPAREKRRPESRRLSSFSAAGSILEVATRGSLLGGLSPPPLVDAIRDQAERIVGRGDPSTVQVLFDLAGRIADDELISVIPCAVRKVIRDLLIVQAPAIVPHGDRCLVMHYWGRHASFSQTAPCGGEQPAGAKEIRRL
jgi:hypothetical protein